MSVVPPMPFETEGLDLHPLMVKVLDILSEPGRQFGPMFALYEQKASSAYHVGCRLAGASHTLTVNTFGYFPFDSFPS